MSIHSLIEEGIVFLFFLLLFSCVNENDTEWLSISFIFLLNIPTNAWCRDLSR